LHHSKSKGGVIADELVEEWRKFSLTANEGSGFTVEDDAIERIR
jgi:hypothetical protein